MANNQTLFFDIETGDLQAERSPVLSISYARGKDIRSLYAAPPKGSFISKWVSENVWKPMVGRIGGEPTRSEESILREFLGVLEGQKGGTISGWNIGYVPTPQAPGVKGLDIPFLMSRASQYGIEEQYQKAFEGVNIRDVGREYSVRVAQEISRHESLVDPKLFKQVESFNKLINTNAGLQRLHSVPEIARWMGTPGQYGGYEVAGWRLKNVYKYLFGEDLSGHHLSEADVLATQRIAEQGDPSKMVGPGFASIWNTEALANKVESSARAAAYLSGIEGNFVGRAAARGANRGWGSFFGTAGKIAREHKLGLGIALGIGALAITKPLRLFSGKDDEYNTIEGLPHGGMGQEMRRRFSDFGSGWLRKAISVGAKEADIVRAMKIATGAEARVSLIEGEKWLTQKTLGAGGFGTAELVTSLKSGRVGVLKTAKSNFAWGPEAIAKGRLVLTTAKETGLTGPGSAAEGFAESYMRDVFAAGKKIGAGPGTIAYEVAMQRQARKELGGIVPEVYGVGEGQFVQEYAGQSLSKIWEGGQVGGSEESLSFIQKRFSGQYAKPGGIAHFDPSRSNVTKLGGKHFIIDWGLAAPISAETVAMHETSHKLVENLTSHYRMEEISKIKPIHEYTKTTRDSTSISARKSAQARLQQAASRQVSEYVSRAGTGHRSMKKQLPGEVTKR